MFHSRNGTEDLLKSEPAAFLSPAILVGNEAKSETDFLGVVDAHITSLLRVANLEVERAQVRYLALARRAKQVSEPIRNALRHKRLFVEGTCASYPASIRQLTQDLFILMLLGDTGESEVTELRRLDALIRNQKYGNPNFGQTIADHCVENLAEVDAKLRSLSVELLDSDCFEYESCIDEIEDCLNLLLASNLMLAGLPLAEGFESSACAVSAC